MRGLRKLTVDATPIINRTTSLSSPPPFSVFFLRSPWLAVELEPSLGTRGMIASPSVIVCTRYHTGRKCTDRYVLIFIHQSSLRFHPEWSQGYGKSPTRQIHDTLMLRSLEMATPEKQINPVDAVIHSRESPPHKRFL